MIRYIVNLFWMLVFFWKRRTGWLDLGEVITVTGTVIFATPPGEDGDRNFDVRLDPGQEKYITGFGGRLTHEDSVTEPSIHCEIEPWASTALLHAFDVLQVGAHVRVSGRWGFDGVHLGRSMWIEVPAAILRHMPNVRDGWFEIHPVETIEVLS